MKLKAKVISTFALMKLRPDRLHIDMQVDKNAKNAKSKYLNGSGRRTLGNATIQRREFNIHKIVDSSCKIRSSLILSKQPAIVNWNVPSCSTSEQFGTEFACISRRLTG